MKQFILAAVAALAICLLPAQAQNSYTKYNLSLMSTGVMSSATLTTNVFAVGNAEKPQVVRLPLGADNYGFAAWASALGGGATATNLFYVNFTTSYDGTNWVTAPSTGAGSIAIIPPGFLQLVMNMNGATAVEVTTNFPAISFNGARFIRFHSTWHPGLTTVTLTNVYGAFSSSPNP